MADCAEERQIVKGKGGQGPKPPKPRADTRKRLRPARRHGRLQEVSPQPHGRGYAKRIGTEDGSTPAKSRSLRPARMVVPSNHESAFPSRESLSRFRRSANRNSRTRPPGLRLNRVCRSGCLHADQHPSPLDHVVGLLRHPEFHAHRRALVPGHGGGTWSLWRSPRLHQSSFNLRDWTHLFFHTNTTPSLYLDPAAGTRPHQFFRIAPR
jgi:hypothetical protein